MPFAGGFLYNINTWTSSIRYTTPDLFFGLRHVMNYVAINCFYPDLSFIYLMMIVFFGIFSPVRLFCLFLTLLYIDESWLA
jgi:hypothetical protein